MCVCVSVFVAVLECEDGISASSILCKINWSKNKGLNSNLTSSLTFATSSSRYVSPHAIASKPGTTVARIRTVRVVAYCRPTITLLNALMRSGRAFINGIFSVKNKIRCMERSRTSLL